jgi:hypothetical protein
MPFIAAAKNTMLDALTIDRIQLHSGAPGAAGTDNVIAATLVAATVGAASAGKRVLSADVDYTGLDALQSVTYISFWDNNGGSPVYHAYQALTGDQAANAAGEYTVTATTTYLEITDSA